MHERKIKIAHLAGPNATITNTPPLVTSNKARAIHGLPLLTDCADAPSRHDVLRPQKLASPVTVYIEQFSAHPLEADAAELYAPPDGYLNSGNEFSAVRSAAADRPVYRVELGPEDGYYPLPYMARQADGSAWETDGVSHHASREETRQPFLPDGSRLFEEIDRFGVGRHGIGSLISNKAEVDFYRVVPSGGYTKGLPAEKRTDTGVGDISAEVPGKDFFPYRPRRHRRSPPRMTLAHIANVTQKILSTGLYDGAIWTQGSPSIEETVYWLNLVLDVSIPVCGNAAQRYHGMISNDGPKNIVDSIDYICSRVWADVEGRDRGGVVLIQDQQVFCARDVAKGDARPGGFVATGGHGGILGAVGGGVGAVLRFVPVTKHTHASELNITRLPNAVDGIRLGHSGVERTSVQIKNGEKILESAIPKVSIIKDSNFSEDDFEGDIAQEVDVFALIDYKLKNSPLAGFVLEGSPPYGRPSSSSRAKALERAVHMGFPVVYVGRGNTEGFAEGSEAIIGGSNLTATKARLLLMLCIMKLGMFPSASNPDCPTHIEKKAIEARVKDYQEIFNSH